MQKSGCDINFILPLSMSADGTAKNRVIPREVKTVTDNSSAVSALSKAPEASAPKYSVLPAIHDAAQQARNLRQVMQDDKQRIGCFVGAGCPLGVYDSNGIKSIVLIPAVVELTARIAIGLKASDENAGGATKYKEYWDSLCAECKSDDEKPPTVEDVLTELRTLANRRGSSSVLGMTKKELCDLDEVICALILDEVNKPLPAYRNAYNRFASWVGGVHRDAPIEIFTPNYDVLFEQAFEQHPLPHFDGFVGSHKPWFDLASIEHDLIPSRWTRLWKLHGSVNWEKSEEVVNGVKVTRVVRVTREAEAGKVMIFPSHLKYDQSRRMPYLAMLDRLRAFFQGKDAPRLVVCGYSFLDEHLNEILLDGLRGNRNAQCFALMYSGLDQHSRAVEYAVKQSNLTVLAWDGAVVGNRVGRYRSGTIGGKEHLPWLTEEEVGVDEQKELQPRSRLGDFHYFGLFLEQLCGGSNYDA